MRNYERRARATVAVNIGNMIVIKEEGPVPSNNANQYEYKTSGSISAKLQAKFESGAKLNSLEKAALRRAGLI